MRNEKYIKWGISLGIGLITLIYVGRIDDVVGQFVDDAWYLVLAKSIANNGAYQLISSPIQGIRPIYPPGFPLILALVLKIAPITESNLWMLKCISILAMMGVGYTSLSYYRNILHFPDYISYICTSLVVLCPAFIFVATSTLMSECVFTCLLLFIITKLEISIIGNNLRNRVILEISLLSAYAFYVRSAAIVIIIGVIIRIARSNNYSAILKMVSVIAICLAPWFVYSKVSYPNNSQREFHGGTIVSTYLESLQMRAAGATESGVAHLPDYFWRIKENIKSIAERDIVGMIFPAVIRGTEESGTELLGLGGGMKATFGETSFAQGAKYFSLFFSSIILMGVVIQCKAQISSVEIACALTLILAVIWPWYTFRFILPFLPFLIGYFVNGLRFIAHSLGEKIISKKNEYAIARVLLISLLFFFLIEHINYIAIKQRNPQLISWVSDFNSISKLLLQVNENLPSNSLIASTNPAQIYLLTKRQGIALDVKDATWEYWRQSGLRYIVNTKPTLPASGKRNDFNRVIYQDSDLPNIQIIDLGEWKK